MEDHPVSAAAVANEFLDLQEEAPDTISIDPLKLQKLIYYAHAWYLAITDHPLIEEKIEAWSWGPVVRDIYFEFQAFGRQPIQGKRATHLRFNSEDLLDFTFDEAKVDDADKKRLIRRVWELHKDYSGIQLSNSTHGAREPWSIIKQKYGSLDSKPAIPNELIKATFRAKIK